MLDEESKVNRSYLFFTLRGHPYGIIAHIEFYDFKAKIANKGLYSYG